MKIIKILVIAFLFVSNIQLFSQKTVVEQYFPNPEINISNSPSHGYFFIGSKSVDAGDFKYYAIIDNYGTPVFFRKINFVVGGIKHHTNGNTGVMKGYPRKLYMYDENMEEMYVKSTEGYEIDPHGWALDENDHVILLGRDYRSVDMSQIYPGGDPNAVVKDLIIQEFDENLNLLYTWNSADHFDILDCEGSPFVDLTSDEIDYVHVNSVEADSDTTMLVSCRHMNEITRINRTNGEIIWRLNGHNNMFTFINDTITFSHQHSIKKLDNGNILLFDNGNTHYNHISSLVEYEIDEQEMTATLVNRFYHDPNFTVGLQGYAQQEAGGNYIAGWGPNVNSASITEYNPDAVPVLELDFTDHSFSTKTGKHDWKTTMFDFNVDTLDFGIWNGSTADELTISITNNTDEDLFINNFSNHTDYFTIIESLPVIIAPSASETLTVSFNPETSDKTLFRDVITICHDTETTRDAAQIWVFGLKEDNESPYAEITPAGTQIETDTIVRISFNEPVRIDTETEFTYENIKEHFIFKEDDEFGTDVGYTAVIDSEKTEFTLIPSEPLFEAQQYYVSFSETLIDYSGNEVIPNETFFATDGWSSIIQKSDHDFSITPNPSDGSVHILSNNFGSLIFFNSAGKKVYSTSIINGNSEINLGALSKGIYFVMLKCNDGSFRMQKLILQ